MLSTKEKVGLLWQRFVHRDDVYVMQRKRIDENGNIRFSYVPAVTGNCKFGCKQRICPHVQRVPLSEGAIIAHLRGEQTIGLYQIKPNENTVKWICFDIDADTEDGTQSIPVVTKEIARVLYKLLGRSFLVEWSGNRGYHIWIFFDEPIPASNAMGFGKFVLSKVDMPDGMHVELFPKQPSVVAYGNLVKLPLGLHQKTGNRCVFVNNKFEPYPLDQQWSLLQNISPLTEKDFDEVLSLYNIQPIERKSSTVDAQGHGPSSLPCMARLMVEGAQEGSRDVCTFKLACYLRDRGISEPMAYAALDEWNTELNNPPLSDAELDTKLKSAIAGNYSPFPCGTEAFDHYCSSSCRLWENKLKSRWTGHKEVDAIGKISRD